MRFQKMVLVFGGIMLFLGRPAESATVLATADTYVTVHSVLGGSSSVHGTDGTMVAIGTAGTYCTPLIQFNLSSFSGQTIVGNASLSVYLAASWYNVNCSQLIEVHQEHSAWSETATSWDNLPGPDPMVFPPGSYGLMGPVLDSQTVTWNGQAGYVSWTIPGSVLQSWIDAPTDNHGIVLVSQTAIGHTDLWFSSREGGFAPQLTFAPVPEPSSFILLGVGVIGLVVFRWRRRSA